MLGGDVVCIGDQVQTVTGTGRKEEEREGVQQRYTSVPRCWVSFHCSRVTVSKGVQMGDTALERCSVFSLLQVINPSFPLKKKRKHQNPKGTKILREDAE